MNAPNGPRAPPARPTAAAQAGVHYVLRLYVAGSAPRSLGAISNIRAICEAHLKGFYDLEILDIAEHPALPAGERILAAPILIRRSPLPVRRFIGDMSDTERILVGLGLPNASA